MRNRHIKKSTKHADRSHPLLLPSRQVDAILAYLSQVPEDHSAKVRVEGARSHNSPIAILFELRPEQNVFTNGRILEKMPRPEVLIKE